MLDLIFHGHINICKEIIHIHIIYGATMRLYVDLMHIDLLLYNQRHRDGVYLLCWSTDPYTPEVSLSLSLSTPSTISKWHPIHQLPAALLALNMKARPRVNSNKSATVHTSDPLEIDYSFADGRSRGLHFTPRAFYQACHPTTHQCNRSPLH